MNRSDDPNPLPLDYACGMDGCQGRVTLRPDQHYRCDNPSCEFDMSYEDMKDCGLFAAWLMEHYGDDCLEEGE
jgi:hypothetical protein